MTAIHEVFERQKIWLDLLEGFVAANQTQFQEYCQKRGYEVNIPQWIKDREELKGK